MSRQFRSYEAIKEWKDEELDSHLNSSEELNRFHDEVMNHVLQIALTKIKKETDIPDFVFFITGSGGRFEQGMISDQDHGIVFHIDDNKEQALFLELGKEISAGLNIAGYPFCEGHVMSSNPLWCKSLKSWKEQLKRWMEDGRWAAIRNLQIFYDARSLFGEECYLKELKDYIHETAASDPFILKRMAESVMHVKNAIGPLGQIIAEEKGKYHGHLDLKYAAFIPYVNAVRILALKESIPQISTLERFDGLVNSGKYGEELEEYRSSFIKLLHFRTDLMKQVKTYDDAHYLNVKALRKEEKQSLKQILKNGKKLHQFVIGIAEKGVK